MKSPLYCFLYHIVIQEWLMHTTTTIYFLNVSVIQTIRQGLIHRDVVTDTEIKFWELQFGSGVASRIIVEEG